MRILSLSTVLTFVLAHAAYCLAAPAPDLPLLHTRIHEFNVEVDRIVARDTDKGCSPMVLTREFLGRQPADFAAGVDWYCRDGAQDTSAVVVVRGSLIQGVDPGSWIELHYRKLADDTWRISSANTSPVTAIVPGRLPSFGIPVGEIPTGARVIHEADLEVTRRDLKKERYRREAEGGTIELVTQSWFPYQCIQPDSTIPIAVRCGPTPDSALFARFAVLAKTDLSVRIFGDDFVEVSSAKFEQVVAGSYLVQLGGAGFSPGTYHVQLECKGKAVPQTVLSYFRPQ